MYVKNIMADKTQTQPLHHQEFLSEIMRRVRTMEAKVEKIEAKILSIENEIVQLKNDVKVYTTANQMKIQELLIRLEEREKELLAVKSSLSEYVRKTEIEKLKTLLDIFNPLKSEFVTREELKTEIEKLLKEFKTQK